MTIHNVIEKAEISVLCTPEWVHPSESLQDAQDIDHVITEAQWNVWMWCTVEVKIDYRGITHSAYMGCCSYDSEDDFKNNSGYYEDMVDEVKTRLHNELQILYAELKGE